MKSFGTLTVIFLLSILISGVTKAGFVLKRVDHKEAYFEWVDDKISGVSPKANVKIPSVDIGLTGGYTFAYGLPAAATLTSFSVAGHSDYNYTPMTCIPLPDQAKLCSFTINFKPTSKGIKTGSYSNTFVYRFDEEGELIYADSGTFFSYGQYRPTNCEVCAKGSVINVGRQTVAESIRLMGTPFSLNYTTAYASSYQPETHEQRSFPHFNENGWTISDHHYFDYAQKRLYRGDGTVSFREGRMNSSSQWMVFDDSGDEYYLFDFYGKHLETRTGLTNGLKYSFGYDSNDKLISISDPFGNTTHLGRDQNDQLQTVTGPYGDVSTLVTSQQRLYSVTYPSGEQYLMTYKSGTDLLETFRKPRGQTSTFLYDANGWLTKDSSSAGNLWELIRNSSTSISKRSSLNRTSTYSSSVSLTTGQFVSTESEASGMVTTHQEELNRNRITTTAKAVTSTRWFSDVRVGGSLNRLFEVKEKIGTNEKITTFPQFVSYPTGATPDVFNFTSVDNREVIGGRVYSTLFDAAGKFFRSTSPTGVPNTVWVDAYERPIQTRQGFYLPTTISYDSRGRLYETSQNGNNYQKFLYDTQGNLQSITNGRNEITSFQYDLSRRVTKTIRPDATFIDYGYDANGNLTSVTPPLKPAHTFQYNLFDFASQYLPPSISGGGNTNTIYSYNTDKQLTKVSRPDGKELDFNYNASTGMLDSIQDGSETTSFTYQPSTDLIQSIDAQNAVEGVRTNFTYFGDRVKSTEHRRLSDNFLYGKVDRSFDSAHRVSLRTVQGNTGSAFGTSMTYTNDDKPFFVGSMRLDYNSSGLLETIGINRVAETRTFDTYGNLKTAQVIFIPPTGPNKVIYSYTLNRDSMGRIESRTERIWDEITNFVYGYDSLGRLTTVTRNGVISTSITYDANGNRSGGTIDGQSFTASYDDQDRVQAYGAKSYAYNNNGDTTGVSAPLGNTTYQYNAESYLTSATTLNGNTKSYVYDGTNNLVQVRENGVLKKNYLYQAPYQIAAELSSTGVIEKEYYFATGTTAPDYMRVGSTQYRIIKDHLGSVRLVINAATGVAIQRIDYNTFGKVTRDTNSCFQPYGFAGGIYDADTKLTRFGARNYDAETGRWTSKDPILFSGGDTNLYGYVMNDPVNWVDPSGLARCTYSISTGKLNCTSNDGSSTGSADMFSGNNDPDSTGSKGGPIPNGKYNITKLPGANVRDWFLDPGFLSRVGYRAKLNRGGFNLHLRKGGSDGCITGSRGENDSNFSIINNILNHDVGDNTIEVGF